MTNQDRARGFGSVEPLAEEMRAAKPDGEDGEGNQAEDQQLTRFAARHHKVPPVQSDLQYEESKHRAPGLGARTDSTGSLHIPPGNPTGFCRLPSEPEA